MKIVCAGTCSEDYLSARGPAKFWCIGRSLNTELLQGLYRNQATRASQRTKSLRSPASRLAGSTVEGTAKVRGNSVHCEVVSVRSLTGNTELSLPTYLSSVSRGDHHARSELQQRIEATPIERQILNELPINDCS